MSQQQSITKFVTRRSARNDAKSNPPAESVASPAKGRTRTTQSPTKKEATVDKKEKVVDSTPRKSSRQKASNKTDAENDTHNKSASPNKKVDPSTKRAEPVTATRSSRSTNADSVKKTPAKNNEPTKSSKSSQYKSTKPVNPIDLIDELQGIEDFLRESTNEQKTPEKTENKEKVEPSSESKATKLSKGKSAVDTPGKKGPETNSSVKSTSKSNDASSTSETKKMPVSEDKLGDEFDIESNSDTGTKRKAELLSEQPSKLAKTEQRNEIIVIFITIHLKYCASHFFKQTSLTTLFTKSPVPMLNLMDQLLLVCLIVN